MMEDRRRILDMLAEGKVTAEEAGLLLEQLGASTSPAAPPVYHPDAPTAEGGPRMVRVRVYVVEANNPKPTNVTINLPLKAARIAGRMAQTMMPEQGRNALRKEGIDLSEMDLVELIDALAETGGDIINVTHEDGDTVATVRIYVE